MGGSIFSNALLFLNAEAAVREKRKKEKKKKRDASLYFFFLVFFSSRRKLIRAPHIFGAWNAVSTTEAGDGEKKSNIKKIKKTQKRCRS